MSVIWLSTSLDYL